MPTFSSTYLENCVSAIFERLDTPPKEARLVAELLVRADLMGLTSHGVLRLPQYLQDIRAGSIVPGAEVIFNTQVPTMLAVDGQWNFGQVAAARMATATIDRAQQQGMAGASLRHCRHVGRLGAYVEMAAAQNCVALACCSSAGEGHWVAPFGGREGRLGTNPIAFAAPTDGDPVLMDFSTSSVPEGKVRLLRDTDQVLPDSCLVDQEGHPSTDPHDLYTATGEPAGAILPFGGLQGYKGYGLGLMAQILTCLVGPPVWREEGIEAHANTMWLLVIDVSKALPVEHFCQELAAMTEYMCSAAPTVDTERILLPGQREFEMMVERRQNGIPLADEVWQQLRTVAAELAMEFGDE